MRYPKRALERFLGALQSRLERKGLTETRLSVRVPLMTTQSKTVKSGQVKSGQVKSGRSHNPKPENLTQEQKDLWDELTEYIDKIPVKATRTYETGHNPYEEITRLNKAIKIAVVSIKYGIPLESEQEVRMLARKLGQNPPSERTIQLAREMTATKLAAYEKE